MLHAMIYILIFVAFAYAVTIPFIWRQILERRREGHTHLAETAAHGLAILTAPLLILAQALTTGCSK